MSAGGIDVKTERDTAIAVFPNSYSGDVLRVFVRPCGTRRWLKFLLVPDEGEGWAELEAKASAAARAYIEQAARVPVNA